MCLFSEMTNVFSLITSLIFFVVMAPTLCVGGGSHLCNNDYDCEWYMAFLQDDDKPEGTSCCTDDRCHESCDWLVQLLVFVLVIQIAPGGKCSRYQKFLFVPEFSFVRKLSFVHAFIVRLTCLLLFRLSDD